MTAEEKLKEWVSQLQPPQYTGDEELTRYEELKRGVVYNLGFRFGGIVKKHDYWGGYELTEESKDEIADHILHYLDSQGLKLPNGGSLTA